MNLRDAARGKPCQARIPGVCNGRNETVVLAHIGIAGIRGMGTKPVDLCGLWACDACHSVIDGRAKHPGELSRETIRAYAMDGVLRTLTILSTAGEWSVRKGDLQWSPSRPWVTA